MTQFDVQDDSKDSSDTKESSDEQEDGIHFPQSYMIVKFAKNVNQMTLGWLVNKIKGQRRDGGAELLVRQQPYDPKEVSTVKHRGCVIMKKWNFA